LCCADVVLVVMRGASSQKTTMALSPTNVQGSRWWAVCLSKHCCLDWSRSACGTDHEEGFCCCLASKERWCGYLVHLSCCIHGAVEAVVAGLWVQLGPSLRDTLSGKLGICCVHLPSFALHTQALCVACSRLADLCSSMLVAAALVCYLCWGADALCCVHQSKVGATESRAWCCLAHSGSTVCGVCCRACECIPYYVACAQPPPSTRGQLR